MAKAKPKFSLVAKDPRRPGRARDEDRGGGPGRRDRGGAVLPDDRGRQQGGRVLRRVAGPGTGGV